MQYREYGIIIPAYNEESRIREVLRRLKEIVIDKNIIVVDDGSSDDTVAVSRAEEVTVLEHGKNRGKGAALRTGYDFAVQNSGLAAVITMDADGQHDPLEINVFIEKYKDTKADIIIGDRMSDTRDMPFIRKMTNLLTSNIVSSRAGCRINDSQSGFRLISCDLLRKLDLVTDHFDAESEILIKAARRGASITSVHVSTIYAEEESKIRPLRDTIRFFRLVVKSFFW